VEDIAAVHVGAAPHGVDADHQTPCTPCGSTSLSALRFVPCSNPPGEKLDAFAIIKSPLTTESAMKKIEDNNTLVRRLSGCGHCKRS
jgi:hypothetical protein